LRNRYYKWQLGINCSYGTYGLLWQHGTYGSTADMTAWQLAAMAAMPGMPARQLCQHGSNASTAAMPTRQLCQQGSYANKAAMPARQL
jgi:hypothetical protein